MSLSPQFLDELRARTLLSALIGRKVKLQRAGREWKACCPFHQEKTPSFTINDDKGFYHCFGCGAHGDAIRFLTEAQGLPFMDAVKELAAAAGMDVPAPDPRAQERSDRAAGLHEVMAAAAKWFEGELAGLRGSEARAYLRQRGISDTTAGAFDFGFAPDSRNRLKEALAQHGVDRLVECGLLIKPEEGGSEPYDRFRGRLMIPIRDARGRVIAFGGRVIGAGEPKYLNSPETPLFDKGRTLFNLDRAGPASRKANRVVVVEGYMDVIALAQAGIEEAVAPLGTALTEGQLERLWRLSDVPLLCFDGDAAGQKAAVRAAVRALPMIGAGRSLSIAVLPEGADPDDLIKDQGKEAFEKILGDGIALDEFIWRSELANGDTQTPEGRASLAKRLREHARTIADEEVRGLYFGSFRQRHFDLFTYRAGSESQLSTAGKWLRERRSTPPELLAIKQYGMAKAVYAPAALKGLIRHPDVIASHAESVGHLSVLLIHRDLRLLCREMLDASLGNHPLETEQLRLILREAGLKAALERLDQRQRVPFSFLKADAVPDIAKRDLGAVLDNLAASPEVQLAVETATERLKEALNEGAFAEQVRLMIVRDKLVGELADLLHRQAEVA